MRLNIEESEKLAGRVIIAGFEGFTLPGKLVEAAERGTLGGVILFKRNVESYEQVAQLLKELEAVAKDNRKPIASVDQEGGRVVRLGEPLTVLKPARTFGEIDDPELTESAGRLIGRELRAVGFSLNFAPVMDVDTNPMSPVIGDRAYGQTPRQVIRHGLAFARGLKDGGVVPCAKHFPGHGDADLDSHVALPRVDHDIERLKNIEMAPFSAWVRTGLGPLMTAHVVYEALDPNSPATLSQPILLEELRGRLRFKGAVFSDDLEMGAMSPIGGPAPTAVKAVRAGVDGLLVCRQEEVLMEVKEALTKESMEDPAFAQKLVKAAARLTSLAYPPGPPVDLSWIGSKPHVDLRSKVLTHLAEGTL